MRNCHVPLLFLLLGGSAVAETIPFTYERRVPFVQVQPVNHQKAPLCFILDTGASTTIINWTTLHALSLDFYQTARPGKDFDTATTCGMGDTPAGHVQGVRATCGALPLSSTALRTDMSNIGRSVGHRVDGLLGTDFLRDKVLTIHFESRTLCVEPAPGTENILTRILNKIPFNRQDVVLVKIATPASRRPLVFLVDTGSSRCMIDTKTARRLNLSLDAQHAQHAVNVVGGQKSACNVSHFTGSLDGHPLPSQIAAFDLSQTSRSLAQPIDGILGMDFLEDFTVKINFHTGQMELLPRQTVLRLERMASPLRTVHALSIVFKLPRICLPFRHRRA